MTAETEGRVAAEKFREDHHLGIQPVRDLITVVERTVGVDVAVVDADPDEHGLTMRDPERGAVFIAAAKTQNPMRQRSTLAHELAHLHFDDWGDLDQESWDERTYEEKRTDSFARHLLIPITGLQDYLGRSPDMTFSVLSSVVQWFLVSPQLAAIALEQAGYIDESTKSNWMTVSTPNLATQFGWRDDYQVLQYESDRARAPQRLFARAVEGYLEGVVSITTLAKLRGVDRAAIATEMEESGLVPNQEAVPWAEAAHLPAVDIDLSGLVESDE